jgi:hypothetical protein
MAQKPQVCVNYPEYAAILSKFQVGIAMENTNSETIAKCLNKLISEPVLYNQLQENCLKASKILNWEAEEKELLECWHRLFRNDSK